MLQKRVSAAGEGEPGYTHALRGWPADLLGERVSPAPLYHALTHPRSRTGPELPWADLRVCALCREAGEDPVSGQLLPFSDGPYAHANCLRSAAPAPPYPTLTSSRLDPINEYSTHLPSCLLPAGGRTR